jgi:hypothetical protein
MIRILVFGVVEVAEVEVAEEVVEVEEEEEVVEVEEMEVIHFSHKSIV